MIQYAKLISKPSFVRCLFLKMLCPRSFVDKIFSFCSIKVAQMFKGCKTEDMPPHVYAMAQAAYRGMLATRRDHSLVFLGRSGSGKTTNFKHALHYLVLAAGTVNKVSKNVRDLILGRRIEGQNDPALARRVSSKKLFGVQGLIYC